MFLRVDQLTIMSSTVEEILLSINSVLRRLLGNDHPNPLKFLMEFDNGCFLLPILHALKKEVGDEQLTPVLKPILDVKFSKVLDRFLLFENDTSLFEGFTLNTIWYCALHSYQGNDYCYNNSVIDRLNSKLQTLKPMLLENIENGDFFRDTIYKVLKCMIPVVYSKQKKQYYEWQEELQRWSPISDINLDTYISAIIYRLKSYTYTRLQTPTLQCLSDMLYHREFIDEIPELNYRKQCLRWIDNTSCRNSIKPTILDLNMSFIGRATPEYFGTLWDNKFHICPYDVWTDQTHHLLMSRPFFEKYYEACIGDLTPDFYQTLVILVQNEISDYDDRILFSFVILCVYCRFDFDIIMCVWNYLADIFIKLDKNKRVVFISQVSFRQLNLLINGTFRADSFYTDTSIHTTKTIRGQKEISNLDVLLVPGELCRDGRGLENDRRANYPTSQQILQRKFFWVRSPQSKYIKRVGFWYLLTFKCFRNSSANVIPLKLLRYREQFKFQFKLSRVCKRSEPVIGLSKKFNIEYNNDLEKTLREIARQGVIERLNRKTHIKKLNLPRILKNYLLQL